MTTTAASLPTKEEMRALGIAGINNMLADITEHPQDAWHYYHRANGAIKLTTELALITEDEAGMFLQKATETRLAVCIEHAPQAQSASSPQ